MKGRELKGSEARGRNGWFVPATVDVYENDGKTHVWFRSRRPGPMPPIVLELSPADRQALVDLLTDKETV